MLALVSSIACVLATSILVACGGIRPGLARAAVGLFVLCVAQVVGVMTVVGLLGQMTLAPVVAAHLAIVTLAVATLRGTAKVGRCIGSWARSILDFVSSVGAFPGWLRAFLIAVAAAYALTLALAAIAPPSIQDAMTYYLGRVGFWIQHESLQFFPTNNPRQTLYPPNASLLFAWTVLLTRSDVLVQLVQWLSACVASLGVYCLARQLGASQRAGVFAGLVWASAPIVILESSSCQIDLITAALVVAACVFSVDYLRHGGPTTLLLASCAIGLAIGSKFTALIMLPGALVVALVLVARGAVRGDRKPLVLSASAAAGTLLLGGVFVYAQGWYHHGAIDAARREYRPGPIEVLRPLLINGVRNTYQLFDTSGIPAPIRRRVDLFKYRTGRFVFGDFAETLLSDRYLMEDYARFGRIFRPEIMYVQLVHPDRVNMGLLGPLLALLPLLVVLIGPRWASRGLTLALATMFASFCVSLCVFAGFHYFFCRYNAASFALLAPLASVLYGERGTRRVVAMAAAALAVLQCWTVVTANENRPFLADRPWWSYDRIGLATITHPMNEGILRQLEERVPADTTIGVATGPSGWIFPFFGPHLERRVVHLAVADELEERRQLDRLGVEFVYVQRRREPVLQSALERPWLSAIWDDDTGVLFEVSMGAD